MKLSFASRCSCKFHRGFDAYWCWEYNIEVGPELVVTLAYEYSVLGRAPREEEDSQRPCEEENHIHKALCERYDYGWEEEGGFPSFSVPNTYPLGVFTFAINMRKLLNCSRSGCF